MKPYLYAFEIYGMNDGEQYDMLQVHCTLVYWFEIEEAKEQDMRRRVNAIATRIVSIALTSKSQDTFTGITKDGPIPVTVDTVTYALAFQKLDEGACDVLDNLGVQYSNPSYVRESYIPHVTYQLTGSLHPDTTHESTSL